MTNRLRKQADKLGCSWNQKQRVFTLAEGEGPPITLTAEELVDLGFLSGVGLHVEYS